MKTRMSPGAFPFEAATFEASVDSPVAGALDILGVVHHSYDVPCALRRSKVWQEEARFHGFYD